MTIEDWLERLDSRLNNLESSSLEIQITQARQAASLDEHIRRTTVAEENIELIRDEMKPLSNHVAMFGVVGKLLGFAGVLLGLATGFYSLFK